MTPRWLLLACTLGACASAAPCPRAPDDVAAEAAAAADDAPSPTTIALTDFRAGLMTVEVEVGGATRTMLFDTGAGITAISPAVVEAIGCEPYGRLTGHRQTDERLDMPLCPEAALTVGDLETRVAPVGVFDIAPLMPPDWPRVDGVIGLNAFAGQRVTLDLACRQLIVGGEAPPAARPARARIARETDGVAVGVFLAARTDRPEVHAWLQVDSANTGPVLVAQHIAERLGVREDAATLDVAGFGARDVEVAVMDLIHDGNLGASYLRGYALSVDLATGDAAVAPTACPTDD